MKVPILIYNKEHESFVDAVTYLDLAKVVCVYSYKHRENAVCDLMLENGEILTARQTTLPVKEEIFDIINLWGNI